MSDRNLKRILLGDNEKYKAGGPKPVGWHDPARHIWKLKPFAKWMAFVSLPPTLAWFFARGLWNRCRPSTM